MYSDTSTNTVQLSECRLRLARPISQDQAPALRALFGRKFEEEIHKQTHETDGTPTYQYPRVQLKVLDSTALLLGVNEGSELLEVCHISREAVWHGLQRQCSRRRPV